MSRAAIGRFLDVMKQSLSHTTSFTGPVEELMHHKTQSSGHIRVISELNSYITTEKNGLSPSQASSRKLDSQALQSEESELIRHLENMPIDEQLPHMPPWFINSGSHKLYQLIAAIIRLAGLSAMAGCMDTFSLSIIIETLLESLRHNISEMCLKEYREEDWQTWYSNYLSGRVLCDAANAVCVLNEIIYGASGRATYTYTSLFKSTSILQEKNTGRMAEVSDSDKCGLNDYLKENILFSLKKWEMDAGTDLSQHLIECVRSILHEYMSSEIWDLPIDFSSPRLIQNLSNQQLPWHFFQDTAMPQQVKDMVVANVDYIINSLCCQLHRLTLNLRAPNILAAILSSIGAVHDILPLLEEPVVIRCLGVIANVIHVCGGEFFIRRLKTDSSHFLRLLSMGAYQSRASFQAKKSMLLPFRKGSNPTDQADLAEGTLLKVQEAFFLMIAAIASDKKSACALEAIFKQMVGLAVGFSCGSQTLGKAATDALLGLSSIDQDLVWLLLADIVYSGDGREVPSPSCTGLPEIAQLLPESPQEYLWVQYAGQNYGLTADSLLARKLLEKIGACHYVDVGH